MLFIIIFRLQILLQRYCFFRIRNRKNRTFVTIYAKKAEKSSVIISLFRTAKVQRIFDITKFFCGIGDYANDLSPRGMKKITEKRHFLGKKFGGFRKKH